MTIRAITYRMGGGKANKTNAAEKRENGGEEKKFQNRLARANNAGKLSP